jgi:hypothetical protein
MWSVSLNFYRSELERKRDYGRHIWQRAGLTWCFVETALFLAPPLVNALATHRLLIKMAPFFFRSRLKALDVDGQHE